MKRPSRSVTPQHIWTWPVVLTLGISLLALAVSGASLTWQIISWRRGGPRVAVTTHIGNRPWRVVRRHRGDQFGTPRTEIKQFGFQLPNGRHMQNIYDFLGQPVGKTGISGSYRRTSAPTSGTAPEGKGSNDGR